MAKTCYARTVGGNWSADATWSTSSGGAADTTKPVATDTAILDANSGQVTVDATSACAILTMTGYLSTLTFGDTIVLTTTGAITLGGTIAGSGYLKCTTSATLTSNSIALGGTNILWLAGTSQTFTFADAWSVPGLTLTGTTAITMTGQSITITGISGVQALAVNTATSGTTTITISGASVLWGGAYELKNTLTITGSVTLASDVYYSTGTLTCTTGTITPSTYILYLQTTCTINTSAVSWYGVYITAGTITINSLLTVTGTLRIPNAAITFAGTAGWTVGTLTNSSITADRTITFAAGITYTITTAFTIVHSGAASTVTYTFISSHAANKAIIILLTGATQNVRMVDPTRIDSSGGQTIYSQLGVITTSNNWSNTISNGNIVVTAGAEASTVAGITKDKNGTALPSCTVYLFKDNGNDTATYVAYVLSNAVTGAYSFTVFPGSAYFVVAFLAGGTPVMDVTDRTVTAV